MTSYQFAYTFPTANKLGIDFYGKELVLEAQVTETATETTLEAAFNVPLSTQRVVGSLELITGTGDPTIRPPSATFFKPGLPLTVHWEAWAADGSSYLGDLTIRTNIRREGCVAPSRPCALAPLPSPLPPCLLN